VFILIVITNEALNRLMESGTDMDHKCIYT